MADRRFEARVRRQVGSGTWRDGVIVDLHGDIDAGAEANLNAAYALAAEDDPRRLLLNFTDVGYINSTGIALIVGLVARARKDHRALLAYGLSEHYLEIFEITRLADFITVVRDEAAAATTL
jgi:anti-sigma B factor antagonist